MQYLGRVSLSIQKNYYKKSLANIKIKYCFLLKQLERIEMI